MYLLLRIKSDCMIVNNYFTVCKHRQPLQLELYQSGLSICTLGSVKVSKSQKHFLLKFQHERRTNIRQNSALESKKWSNPEGEDP